MHANIQAVDWSSIGSGLYSYWFIGVSLLTFIAWLFRLPIARRAKNIANALRSAKEHVRKINMLEGKLAEARGAADDWRTRYSEMEARYEALQTELNRLGDDLREFRKRMTTAEMLVRVLTHDRDALIDFSRLLIGQLYTGGRAPDYPTPPLESMVDVPGPPLPPYPEAK